MISRLKSLLGLGLVAAAAAPSTAEWPALPETGFISGRAATPDDIAAGNAVFSIEPAGRPIPIEIPQYAYWVDEHGQREPMIVVQAEYGPNGEEIVGMRAFDGSESVATMPEVTLLGATRPQ